MLRRVHQDKNAQNEEARPRSIIAYSGTGDRESPYNAPVKWPIQEKTRGKEVQHPQAQKNRDSLARLPRPAEIVNRKYQDTDDKQIDKIMERVVRHRVSLIETNSE